MNTRSKALGVFDSLISREKTLTFSVLAVLVLYLPTVISSQIITGTLVNMTLILATLLIGPYVAIVLGLMPSGLALLSGLLPLPLAPMIPFIIIGNIILIGVYHYLGEKNFIASIFTAAFLKFLFLFSTGYILGAMLLNSEQASVMIASVFGWTQLLTAILGGFSAFLVLSILRKVRRR